MKRPLTIKPFLSLLFVLSLTACGGSELGNADTNNDDSSANDTTAPTKAIITSTPNSTYKDTEIIEIKGEAGATVWVNGIKKGTINSDGKLSVTLDTSGDVGTKEFSIVIKDSNDNVSEPLVITIEHSLSQLPDTTAPDQPQLTSPVTSTNENTQAVEISGEAEASVWINSVQKGVMAANGKLILTLDTSGEDGIKRFSIVLKDANNNASEALVVSIEKTTIPIPPTITGTPKTTSHVYNSYQFQPTAEDANGDTLTFSINNKPAWATFDTQTGLLQGTLPKDSEGNFENIVISVTDGKTAPVALAPFAIEVSAPLNIAHLFGKATQNSTSSYQYYHDPANAIDNNLDTMNMASSDGWLQIALPKGSTLAEVNIQNRTDTWTTRLNGTKVYIGTTAYNGTEALDESNYVGTLTSTKDLQKFTFETLKSADYILLKGSSEPLHILEVRAYGVTPPAPAFINTEDKTYTQTTTPLGTSIGQVSAIDYQGDTVSFSTTGNTPFVVDASGNITVNGPLNWGTYNVNVIASDGVNTTRSTVPIRVNSAGAPINIAHKYGVATQSEDATYYYYHNPEYAIDNDLTTNNMTANKGWLQVALPKGTKVEKVVVRNILSGWTYRLNGAKIYLGMKAFDGTIVEGDEIGTLTSSSAPQVFTFNTLKNADYVLIKEDDDNLHVLEVEVYGEMPTAPAFLSTERNYLISGRSDTGSTIIQLPAIDYQEQAITYQILGDVPFAIDAQGNITVSGTLNASSYTFEVQSSDGTHATTTPITVNLTSRNVIEELLASGDVTKTSITEAELIQATLDDLEATKNQLNDAKIKILNLNADGTAKSDGSSLTHLNWDPSHDAITFATPLGDNTPLLNTNAVSRAGYEVKKEPLAIIGERNAGRYVVLGTNPFRGNSLGNGSVINDDMQKVLENTVSWLTKKDNLKTAPFNVVLAHLSDTHYFRDETTTRAWLDSHFAGQVHYNTQNSCEESALAACLTESTDLLIISQISTDNENIKTIAATVKQALDKGIGVLYFHYNEAPLPLGTELFNTVFNVQDKYHNTYHRLSIEAYNPANDLGQLSEDAKKLKTTFTHFKNNDYQLDWSQCTDASGNQDENNDRCNEIPGMADFQTSALIVKNIVDKLDSNKTNVFNESGYRLVKLLTLVADKFRQNVHYPMDKVTTDDTEYMKSYYADHVIYNFRKINPVQPDMGNFSRSNFTHITPITKTLSLSSRKWFRPTGVYALPGKTMKITRHDSSDLTVHVFINTLRSGATHQFQKLGYNRPKFLKTPFFKIKTGETIEITSPYGGPIQLIYSANDLPVNMTFENVGEHPYWASSADNATFTQKLADKEYDWAEVATAGFVVHSKLDKMIQSVEDARWGGTAEGMANAVVKYTSNYPHVLAGFKGEGVDVVPEIHNWAKDKGLTIEAIDFVKHMNADQATCGYGCSGNPYDAYWAFDPIGHGDIHEMGHNMQKKRFEGFPNHAATNTFSYYTKARYFDQTGGEPDCQSLPFKSLYEKIQSSVGQADVKAYLKTNLWDKANLGEQYLLKIQAMMHAQKLGKLENGWHVLARVHILEREKGRALQDWDNRKASIGFSSYTRDEFTSIRDNDWLIVSYSYAAGLDYRDYFDMMGIPYSQKARDQIASFGFDAAPKSLFVSTDTGYCKQDAYGRIFDRPTLPIDGTTNYLY